MYRHKAHRLGAHFSGHEGCAGQVLWRRHHPQEEAAAEAGQG